MSPLPIPPYSGTQMEPKRKFLCNQVNFNTLPFTQKTIYGFFLPKNKSESFLKNII
jgi:hypothetical protein